MEIIAYMVQHDRFLPLQFNISLLSVKTSSFIKMKSSFYSYLYGFFEKQNIEIQMYD